MVGMQRRGEGEREGEEGEREGEEGESEGDGEEAILFSCCFGKWFPGNVCFD